MENIFQQLVYNLLLLLLLAIYFNSIITEYENEIAKGKRKRENEGEGEDNNRIKMIKTNN